MVIKWNVTTSSNHFIDKNSVLPLMWFNLQSFVQSTWHFSTFSTIAAIQQVSESRPVRVSRESVSETSRAKLHVATATVHERRSRFDNGTHQDSSKSKVLSWRQQQQQRTRFASEFVFKVWYGSESL